jgi:hypothetical protein
MFYARKKTLIFQDIQVALNAIQKTASSAALHLLELTLQ